MNTSVTDLRALSMHRILPITSATVMGIPLTYPVLAHSGEFHGRPADPAETSAPDNSNSDSGAIESETPASNTQPDTAGVIEVDTTVSQPQTVAGLPAGLGESLFTILVGVPWLLIALRMKLHP